MKNQFLTVAETAKILRLSPRRVQELAQAMTHPEELSTPCAVFMEGNPMKYILGAFGIAYWLGHFAVYLWR